MRNTVATRVARIGLQEISTARAFGADCEPTPITPPVFDPVSHSDSVTHSDLSKRHQDIRSGLATTRNHGALSGVKRHANGSPEDNPEDRSDARRLALQLVDDGITPFAALVKKGCTIHLYIPVNFTINFTGGFISRKAIDDAADRDRIAKALWSVGQICFVAADVSSTDMANRPSNSNAHYRHWLRLTKDHNPYDSVLKLSNVKRIGVAPRAGRVGLPENTPAKAFGDDCGGRFLGAHIYILTKDTNRNAIPSLNAFQSILCRIPLIQKGTIGSASLSTGMHSVVKTSRGIAPVPIRSITIHGTHSERTSSTTPKFRSPRPTAWEQNEVIHQVCVAALRRTLRSTCSFTDAI